MQRRGILTAALFIALFWPKEAHSDLKTLMEMGRNQAEIARTLRQETAVYESVKKAVESGAIKTGMSADSVRKKYGEPVVNIHDKECGADRWLYMPAESSHFKGEKIYLYFDNENKLAMWKKVEQ